MIIILISGTLGRMHEVAEESWSELALAAVTSDGRRAGAARRAVIELLAGERCCLGAQDIAERLRAGAQPVGVASVYRTLDLLSAEGLVQRVDVGGGALYEAVVPGGEHHHHAVCERCGALTPFEDPALERAIDGLAGRLGHRVQAHDVLIRGECGGCAGS
jgi:Fur family ferric uptake transcriptional regulator